MRRRNLVQREVTWSRPHSGQVCLPWRPRLCLGAACMGRAWHAVQAAGTQGFGLRLTLAGKQLLAERRALSFPEVPGPRSLQCSVPPTLPFPPPPPTLLPEASLGLRPWQGPGWSSASGCLSGDALGSKRHVWADCGGLFLSADWQGLPGRPALCPGPSPTRAKPTPCRRWMAGRFSEAARVKASTKGVPFPQP